MGLQTKSYHQRGESIMPQGILPYKYEEERKPAGMTSLAGLPVYLDLACALGLPRSIDRHLTLRPTQGWTDRQMILTLILLALAGGDCVDDLKVFESDDGFCRVLEHIEPKSSSSRWRVAKSRTIPSPSSAFRYLSSFHTDETPVSGSASIPHIPALTGLAQVNCDMIASIQKSSPSSTATLDMDATLIETTKKEALFCYEGYKAYQSLNVYWAEQELLVHTEFRDGNVPAGYDLLRVFRESLDTLPEGIKRVRLRTDGAGYCHDLLSYCERGASERFGRIEFTVSAPVTDAFRKEVQRVLPQEWKRLDHVREWAEVGYVPSELAHSKKGPVYRYLAIREAVRQPALPGMELPFQTFMSEGTQYKLRGLVSNMDWQGERLITFAYERCGKSEEAHSILKEDLFGGALPSGNFGENGAWWGITVLAFNLSTAMKKLGLGLSFAAKRMKAIRFAVINVAGRIIEHARQLVIKITKDHPSLAVLIEARQRIMRLAPSG
jgi:hypothetical protein